MRPKPPPVPLTAICKRHKAEVNAKLQPTDWHGTYEYKCPYCQNAFVTPPLNKWNQEQYANAIDELVPFWFIE